MEQFPANLKLWISTAVLGLPKDKKSQPAIDSILGLIPFIGYNIYEQFFQINRIQVRKTVSE